MGAGAVKSVGFMCLMISIWGSIQLFVMAICYKFEAVTLFEDCEPEEHFDTYEEFIEQVQKNYAAVSLECFIAAGIYVVFIILSIVCIYVANIKLKKQALKFADDENFCLPKKLY